MKKLFQKLLSPKEEREKPQYQFQPTQQQTPSPMIVRSPPKEDAKKRKKEKKKTTQGTLKMDFSSVKELVCKDFETENDVPVDLNAVLQCEKR